MISYKGKEYIEYDNAIALLEEKDKEIQRLKEEYMILQNASDEVEEKKDEEIERLNTNLEVANEDLTRIAQLLNLEEGCTIHDIEDKIERLNNIINEFEDFITNVDSHINLGDESEEFILVRDKWLELQELKGSDKEC